MSLAERAPRVGLAVIEVLIAFVLVASAGVGLVTLLGETSHTMQQVRRAEADTEAAAALLEHLEIASQSEFAAMAGTRRVRGFDLRVTASPWGLFDVAVVDTATGGALLQSTFYRPDSSRAP